MVFNNDLSVIHKKGNLTGVIFPNLKKYKLLTDLFDFKMQDSNTLLNRSNYFNADKPNQVTFILSLNDKTLDMID